MFCGKCGKQVAYDSNWCPFCGEKMLIPQKLEKEICNNEYDSYEDGLEKKKKIEEKGIFISIFLGIIICGVAIVNNWGYRDFSEIVIICILVVLSIAAIYNAMAESMGVYKAGENLEKYRRLKVDIGRTEAIKTMEESMRTKEGYTMLKSGIKGGFELTKALIKGIMGLIGTILLAIIAISLC